MIDRGGITQSRLAEQGTRVRQAASDERAQPVWFGVLLLIALVFTVARAQSLLSWSGAVVDIGPVVVTESCDDSGGLRSPVWRCGATVLEDPSRDEGGPLAVDSKVILHLPRSGSLANRAFLGQEVDAFAHGSDTTLVYPHSAQLSEIARLYVSLLSWLAILFGLIFWAFGWLLDRTTPVKHAYELINRPSRSLPETWRSRGFLWVSVGLILGALNVIILERLIGSLGVT